MTTNDDKGLQSKRVGGAIQALRAFIKALEMAEGLDRSNNQYRYEISADRTTARIVDTTKPVDGEPAGSFAVVEGTSKTLDEWKELGRKVRLAFIGLKDTKIQLEKEAADAGVAGYFRFSLDLIQGNATLSAGGEVRNELPEEAKACAGKTLADFADKDSIPLPARPFVMSQIFELPTDIEGWAKIGREVEQPWFESLKMATDYGSEAGVRESRREMVKRGIIRAPRDGQE